MSKAMKRFYLPNTPANRHALGFSAGYSPDVEIDHDGGVVAVRDIAKGEVISIPLHMLRLIKSE